MILSTRAGRPIWPPKVCALFLVLLLASQASVLAQPETMEISVSSDDDIAFSRFTAEGEYILVMFAPEYGLKDNHRRFAGLLSDRGIEVWLGNLQESLFLPDGTGVIRQLDTSTVAELVDIACESGKRVVLAGDAYGAVIALRGAHDWQRSGTSDCLAGAVLFSPYAYQRIPALGEEPVYLPVISATNIPLLIYQAEHSATHGRFGTLLAQLRSHGSPIYTTVMPDIMSLFYEEPATEAMQSQADRVAGLVAGSLPLLASHDVPDSPTKTLERVDGDSGVDIALRPFSAELRPLPIDLVDTAGNRFVRDGYRDRITLVNFWATWCPPCVEEIPSLNALRETLQNDDFDLISINYAEPVERIREFMARVSVDFPVLLDPHGEFSKQWKVVALPSSFIIDRAGDIRYGVNAAIDWNAPEVVAAIQALAGE